MSNSNKIPESARGMMNIGVGILLGYLFLDAFGDVGRQFARIVAVLLLSYGLFHIFKLRSRK